jgi:hypothetical protein
MIARRIYQVLLRLHPIAFRERFAEEMLWIFDETVNETGLSRLCADATFSLFKQHMATDTVPRPASKLFQGPPMATLSAARIVQAGIIASIAMVGFLKLVQQSVPLPQPPRTFAVRRYYPDVCSERSMGSPLPRRKNHLGLVSE